MDQVQLVALWAGLLTGVASIVLSIVAIVFSFHADKRGSELSKHTIESLQKIETTVGRQSADTTQLIKAAWDKLLGAVDHGNNAVPASASAKAIAEGLATELHEDLKVLVAGLGTNGARTPAAAESQLTSVVGKLEEVVEALLRQANAPTGTSDSLDRLINTIAHLSPEAHSLLIAIRRHHLSRNQYRQLGASPFLGSAIAELRRQGLIIPVRHGDMPCYFYPPGIGKLVHAAKPLLEPVSQEIESRVQEELKSAGYPEHNENSESTPRSHTTETTHGN